MNATDYDIHYTAYYNIQYVYNNDFYPLGTGDYQLYQIP